MPPPAPRYLRTRRRNRLPHPVPTSTSSSSSPTTLVLKIETSTRPHEGQRSGLDNTGRLPHEVQNPVHADLGGYGPSPTHSAPSSPTSFFQIGTRSLSRSIIARHAVNASAR